MLKSARKLAFTFLGALPLCVAIFAMLDGSPSPAVAQTMQQPVPQTEHDNQSHVAVLADPKPQWRYTRLGWQDANDWAMVGQIEGAPERRFDALHPVVLAMLILFSVLASALWASNEWELAQLMGDSDQS